MAQRRIKIGDESLLEEDSLKYSVIPSVLRDTSNFTIPNCDAPLLLLARKAVGVSPKPLFVPRAASCHLPTG